jgi:hypothetical protein
MAWSESDLEDALDGSDASVSGGSKRGSSVPDADDTNQLPLTLVIPGKPPSLNTYYSGQHWSKRKRVRDDWHEKVALLAPDIEVTDYPVSVTCEVRFSDGRGQYDTDNCVAAAKLITDGLEEAGVLDGDTPKHIDSVTLRSVRHGDEPEVMYRLD